MSQRGRASASVGAASRRRLGGGADLSLPPGPGGLGLRLTVGAGLGYRGEYRECGRTDLVGWPVTYANERNGPFYDIFLCFVLVHVAFFAA